MHLLLVCVDLTVLLCYVFPNSEKKMQKATWYLHSYCFVLAMALNMLIILHCFGLVLYFSYNTIVLCGKL